MTLRGKEAASKKNRTNTWRNLIVFVSFFFELLIGIFAFSNVLILLILAIIPPIMSFAFLQLELIKEKEHTRKNAANYGDKRIKMKIPKFLFGFVFIPIAIAITILAYNSYYFEPLGILYFFYSVLSFLALVLSFMLTIFFVPLAIHSTNNTSIVTGSPRKYPLLSIIVPAYNEEKNLKGTLDSLIEADYFNKEIIVVNDGSTDGTYHVASKYSNRLSQGRFSVLSKSKGGKSTAVNFGIRNSKGEIVVVIDADSRIERNALKEIAKEIQRPGVIAVAGGVKILNRTNLLTYCQALEYMISINVHRRAFGSSGITLIVPGPLGAFSKKAIIERGLFDNNTSTEDFDTTMKMLKTGGVVPEIFAQSYTNAPDTLRNLYQQRSRWYRGAFQTLLKHKGVMSASKYGILGEFLYPIKLLSFLILPFFDLILIAFGIIGILTGEWIFPLIWISLYLCWQSLMSTISIMLEKEKNWLLVLFTPLFVIGYRQFIDFLIVKSIIKVLLTNAAALVNSHHQSMPPRMR
jgi:cellulose synthase/poly-beta-1,6-N-acetylglucosamine synthase-like glycosyltransferase